MRPVSAGRLQRRRGAAVLLSVVLTACVPGTGAGETGPLPEFPRLGQDAWINSAPLTLQDLRGEVVLLDVWTFG